MKNIYKLLAILLFAFTATLNAQLINSDGTKNDEFLGKQKQPVINNGCECVNSDIDNFSFTYSSSFAYALANDRAVIEAAKREAWDWYNHQTDLMKDYIGTKNNKTFNSFNEAKDFLFKKTEYNNLRRNSPLTRDKMSQGYNQTNHASKTGLKALKALDHRESEIRAGNLNSSLYPDFKVNNTFLKDIRTISDLNNIRATTNTTTLDGLSKAPEFRALRDMMNTIISSGNYSQFESKAFIAKNNVYNSYGIWDKLNMMQFVIHHDLHKNYVSFPYNIPTDAFNKFFNRVDIATPDYIEKEIRNEYTDYDVFHDEYWRVILRDKYNNAGAMTGIAKAEHQKLRDKAYNDRKNATPIGASLDVDRIVKQLNIRDKYERLWINANKDKATEFLNRLREAKKKDEEENANPIPDNQIISIVGNNYESEIANINNEFAAGARIAKLAEELNIENESQRGWLLDNENIAITKDLADFADYNRINGELEIEDIEAARLTISIAQNNLLQGPYSPEYFATINNFTGANISTPLQSIWIAHFSAQCAILRAENPDWSSVKVYWEASKEMIHIALDIGGMVPVVGEVCDLVNGVIYTIEGDGVNASLSFAAVVPIVGWGATTSKYAYKITASTLGTKVKLTWKILNDGLVYFGSSGSKLRKVLGLTDVAKQAHHIMPWADVIKNHPIIQKAAKSGSAFHMNEALNGIAVAAWRNQPNHPVYTNLIKSKLDDFNNLNPNASLNEAYNFVSNLVNDVRTWVINNPNKHLNELILP
ncbi:hypothetical protein [Tenacibaculum sp. 190524A05c]|uniref:hypothetical protein n=1 Tax=Tenacibaculum platacis TaxID=3137852 RepID=UPI0032B26D7E